MCGIVGIVAANDRVDPPVLQRMNDLLAHRGPDGEGFVLASGDWTQLRYSFQRRADDDARRFAGPRRPWPSAPRHSRPVRPRAAADVHARRQDVDCLQWRDLQPPGNQIAARVEGPCIRDENRHRGSAERVRANGEKTASADSTACLRSPCGTMRTAACSAPETVWGSSRSITPLRTGTSCSRRRSRRSWRFPSAGARPTTRRRSASWCTATAITPSGRCFEASRRCRRRMR